jgi:hypothetical protein
LRRRGSDVGSEEPHAVYYLYSPELGTPPRYVGICRANRHYKRLGEHITEGKILRRRSEFKTEEEWQKSVYPWVHSLLQRDQIPRLEIKEYHPSREVAEEAETRHVSVLRSAGITVLNGKKNKSLKPPPMGPIKDPKFLRPQGGQTEMFS